MAKNTIYLKNYTPPSFAIESVYLEFDLHDTHARVTNRMQLRRLGNNELRLMGEELQLIELSLNGVVLKDTEFECTDTELVIKDCPEVFDLLIVTQINPAENTSLSGLFRSNQLFCTQCEAEGFRRITYFLDRPDVMTVYTTKISADAVKYPVLLSNGNCVDSGTSEDGRHWVVWNDPYKKPSYLFALVAGDLVCVSDAFTTASGKVVDLRLYVEPGQEALCGHALDSLKKAMRWDEERFGREYDLDIFMIVAVSDFNMGAMENKGLNIFNASCVLASPKTATDRAYAVIESIVAHEYFHNWTGNRVTCRDWFQLSLKEGLTVFRDQEFSADMSSRDVERINQVSNLRNQQFPEDAGLMAHPVRPSSYEAIDNFYTATVYEKGAEVIRMQHTLLGEAGFRRGMDLYFSRHDGQAVTIDDFVGAMEAANQVDLTQFKRWYSQAGTPVVTVQEAYANGKLTLTFSQRCAPTPGAKIKKPFVIPILFALFDSQGKRIRTESSLITLVDAEQVIELDGLPEKPLVSLLRQFSAPVVLQTEASASDLLALMRCETDGVAKWEAIQQLARRAILSYYHAPDATWNFSSELAEAYREVLTNTALDEALRAELLDPPGFNEILAFIPEADVARIELARDFFKNQLARALVDDAFGLYSQLWKEENHAMTTASFGRRALRNVCLCLMMHGALEKALPTCHHQFVTAETMTDQLSSLALLVNSKAEALRQQALDAFFHQWEPNPLVLNKWFSLQAGCELDGTLKHVRALLKHPAFNLKNPDKVRALIRTFCEGNPRHFHAADGQGYAFLSEMLLLIDPINPLSSASLADPFSQWPSLDASRQAAIKSQLQYLSQQKISKNLREIVTKCLSEDA